PFAADDELMQAHIIGAAGELWTEHIEIVAADAPQDARIAAYDLVALLAYDLAYAAIQLRFQGLAGRAALPLGGRQWREHGSLAVRQHDIEPAHVTDGFAVDDGARAGRVVADH